MSARHPAHVTLRLGKDVPNIRRQKLLGVLLGALRESRERQGFRLCHFVVLGNHLHLIVEADGGEALARGMQGLCIRLAKRVNGALGRKGRFFADRFHARMLRTPTEVHRALRYVLLNRDKHSAEGGGRVPDGVDAFSSGAWFEGWRRVPRGAERIRTEHSAPVAAAGSWLLKIGWKRAERRARRASSAG